jgi:plasminogen activator inhibitor 1 RNA-binding protein
LRGKGRGRAPRDGGGRGRDRVETTPTGKRVFERHSGTGRGKEQRKSGYGGGGAEGTVQDELAAVEDAKKDQTQVQTKTTTPQQPEEKVVTLADYEEQLKKKQVTDEQKKSLRQAEEPKDSKLFKKGKTFEKKEENFYDIKKPVSQKSEQPKEKTQQSKSSLSIDEFVARYGGDEAPQQEVQQQTTTSAPSTEDNSANQQGFVETSDRRQRGGRGRGRGNTRGGRGGNRGGSTSRGGRSHINLKDDNAFPTLGGRK